jgi:predicted acylesterase/phospholipase RssA
MASRPRVAFVAGGGSLKAVAWHLGVMRVLEAGGFRRRLHDEHTPPEDATLHDISLYVGCSAGASFCTAAMFFADLEDIAAGLGIGPARAGVPRLKRGDIFRLAPFWRRRTSGLFTMQGLAQFLRQVSQHDDFRRLGPQFFVPATPLNHRRKVVFGPRDSGVGGHYNREIAYYSDVPISEAVAASSSMPILFSPYPIVNRSSGETFHYLDGEVRDAISAHIARDNDADLAIISHVWVPYTYDKKHGSLIERGAAKILLQALCQTNEHKIEAFRYDDERCIDTLDAARSFCAYKGLSPEDTADLVEQLALNLNHRRCPRIEIAPDPDDAELLLTPSMSFDLDRLEAFSRAGAAAATRALARWQRQTGGLVAPASVPA